MRYLVHTSLNRRATAQQLHNSRHNGTTFHTLGMRFDEKFQFASRHSSETIMYLDESKVMKIWMILDSMKEISRQMSSYPSARTLSNSNVHKDTSEMAHYFAASTL